MGNTPLVSVVIATYNMGNYLPLAIRSALDQTYANVEVLVIDDGSTDETSAAVKSFLADPRLIYIRHQPNVGQALAKNHGVREARGEFVAFLDADDYWHASKLERQLALFDRRPSLGVVFSRVMYIDEQGKESRTSDNALFRGRVSGPLLITNFIAFGTTVVRKECFECLGSFDESFRMGIDYDLWLRFSTLYEFDYIDQPLLYYRVWSGQMSNDCRNRYINGIRIMENFLNRFPGAVDARTVSEAWAHTYVGFGDCTGTMERSIRPALSLYGCALRHKPTYLPAWKSIIKTALRIQ